MSFTTTIQPALDRARRLPASLVRRGRWSVALGALLLTASTSTALAATNTPPTILSASVSPQVRDAGQTLRGAPNDNTEGAGQDVMFVLTTVKNLAPTFDTPIEVASQRVSATQVLVKLDGTIVDDAADTHQVTVVGGSQASGSKQMTPASSCTVQGLRFHCLLTYGAQDIGTTKQVQLRVKDDEGAQAATTVTVRVQEASDS